MRFLKFATKMFLFVLFIIENCDTAIQWNIKQPEENVSF